MSINLSELRSLHGTCYITQTSDGQFIPWKPLSIGEWLKYKDAFGTNLYAPAVLENEIFKLCVLDPFIVKHIDKQKAGTVTTIVNNIITQSGPQNVNEFNGHLNYARNLAQQPIHQIVSIICQIFSAYKPEEVYALDYETLMLRLAQAEERMFKMGLKTEPFELRDESGKFSQKAGRKNKRFDSDKLKEAFEQLKNTNIPKNKQKVIEDITPTAQSKVKNNSIIVTKEEMATNYAIGGHADDIFDAEQQMLKDAALLYKDYLEDVKSGKPVKIKSVEERIEALKNNKKRRPSKLKQNK